MLKNAVEMARLKNGWKVLMFLDASDPSWGSFLTQVPSTDFAKGLHVEDMYYEPLGFRIGAFMGSQLRWPVSDKEALPIVSTFTRLEYLLWGGVCIYCDRRNLAYIISPEELVSLMSKATVQRHCAGVLFEGDFRVRSCTSRAGRRLERFTLPAAEG